MVAAGDAAESEAEGEEGKDPVLGSHGSLQLDARRRAGRFAATRPRTQGPAPDGQVGDPLCAVMWPGSEWILPPHDGVHQGARASGMEDWGRDSGLMWPWPWANSWASLGGSRATPGPGWRPVQQGRAGGLWTHDGGGDGVAESNREGTSVSATTYRPKTLINIGSRITNEGRARIPGQQPALNHLVAGVRSGDSLYKRRPSCTPSLPSGPFDRQGASRELQHRPR